MTSEYHPGDDALPDATFREEPSLEVSWNRDGSWVQVAYVAPTDWWDRFMADDPNGVHGPKYRTAYTDVLTRQEINNLIRTLRRARDAAYGSDE